MPKVLASSKALIYHNGKYLIVKESLHRGENVWDLPGGKIEYGENPEETVMREVKEELCLNVKVKKSVGVWWFYSQNNKHQVICHTYLCELVGEPKIDTSKNPADEDIIGFEWLTIEEILNHQEIRFPDSLYKLFREIR